jgi:hypothetical protein
MTTTETNDTTGQPATFDGAYRGRRISWREFWKQRPDLRPDNDNDQCPNHMAAITAK